MLKTSRAADPNPAFDLDWNNNVYVWDWDFGEVHKRLPQLSSMLHYDYENTYCKNTQISGNFIL